VAPNSNSKHKDMGLLVIAAQVIIALSIVVVWVLRFENIEREFKSYRLSPLVRNMVGATKIAMATLLVAGIWYPYPGFVIYPALVMAFLMVCAQFFHFRAKSPVVKRLPSLVLMLLSLLVAAYYAGWLR
jgi:tellurite resistance protein TehA-like permease